MALQSMTGYARTEGNVGQFRWVWELKSVNGKSLDIRWRLPNGYDFLERELRSRLSAHVSRGNFQISLSLEQDTSDSVPKLNEAALEAVVAIANRIKSETRIAPLTLDGLLSVKGVLEQAEPPQDEKQTALRNSKLLASFDEACSQIAESRMKEGAAIGKALSVQIAEIERLTEMIGSDPSRSAEAIRKSLQEKLAKLLDVGVDLDPQRLYQEAAILATKADLQEELDRLESHIAAARELLNSEGAVGRKFDFLAQEFNRECNTVCSKSNSSEATRTGLEMKVIIDQFREQIQNIQ